MAGLARDFQIFGVFCQALVKPTRKVEIYICHMNLCNKIEKISVVIPSYNRAHCILNALESVLNQTILVDEIIIVDDGSTDYTADLFVNHQPNVFYYQKENEGVSSARNYGLSKATGAWIAFLDSDDIWLPNKLELQFRSIFKHGCEICFTAVSTDNDLRPSHFLELDSSLESEVSQKYLTPVQFIARSVYHPMVQTLLIRTDILRKIGGFDQSLYVAEDTSLYYTLIRQFEICLLNIPLVKLVRQNSHESLSRNLNINVAAKRYECYLRVQARALDIIIENRSKLSPKEFNYSIRTVNKRISFYFLRLAEISLAQNNYEASKAFARFSVFNHSSIKNKFKAILFLYFQKFLIKFVENKWSHYCPK